MVRHLVSDRLSGTELGELDQLGHIIWGQACCAASPLYREDSSSSRTPAQAYDDRPARARGSYTGNDDGPPTLPDPVPAPEAAKKQASAPAPGACSVFKCLTASLPLAYQTLHNLLGRYSTKFLVCVHGVKAGWILMCWMVTDMLASCHHCWVTIKVQSDKHQIMLRH